jgi:hypothetical protein
MKIQSDYKDYYDYVAGAVSDHSFKEKVYQRKTEYKDAIVDFPTLNRLYVNPHSDAIKSIWWMENTKKYQFHNDNPSGIDRGCLFVCGKAFPFFYTGGYARIIPDNKSSRLVLSTNYDRTKQSKEIEVSKHKPESWHFFKTYFSEGEFANDITIVRDKKQWWNKHADDNKTVREFLDTFSKKDFTDLHIMLDCPVILTFFNWLDEGRRSRINKKPKTYQFLTNPNLYEFGFARVIPAEILYQEIDVFLGNELVKDIMPPSYQSDIDKIKAHGFDVKTSFRKPKSKV